MDITIISPMSEAEARECINRLRRALTDARTYALALQEREGWRALGYSSLKECFINELGSSWQHGYRLIAAAEVDANLSEYSPTGESFQIPTQHTRQLAKLPAPKQIVAYDRAQTLATSEGAKQVTGRHVEMAVSQVQAEMSIADSPVIAHAVAAGEITADDGVKIQRELESLNPALRAPVLTLMTEHGLRDPKLVVPLGLMSARSADNPSKVFEEIVRTGHVAGVPLAQATLTDLKKLKEEAQKEHISESEEKKRQQMIELGIPAQEPVVITVYKNAPKRTYAALVQALGVEDLKTIAELLMEHVIDTMEKAQVEA
jgi:hypothetical protein